MEPASSETAAPSASTNRTAWFWGLVYFLTGLAIVIHGQFLSGITRAEFGHFPDEPAHAMTAVFFRDYFAAHLPSPMRFAEGYYLHYPKIAIGVWPPFFYVICGAWLLVFGTSHVSFLGFMAAMGAGFATATSLLVRRVAGPWLGWCSGAVLLCLRPLRFSTTAMMVDTTLSLMCLLAAFSLIRYLRTARTMDAVLFGFLTAFAMLTKGNALELLIFAPVLIVSSGNWRVLLRGNLYVAAVPIVLLGVPWQILSVRMLRDAALIQSAGGAGIPGKAAGYLAILFEQLGPVAIVGALVAAAVFFLPFSGETRLNLIGAASLTVAVYIFHVFAPVPGPDGRYMMAALPGLICLFCGGVWFLAHRLNRTFSWMAYAAAALLMLAMPAHAWSVTRQEHLGVDEAALAVHNSGARVVLINAESSAEGAFIVSLALLDHRPERFVIRSSKLMSDNSWSETEYHPRLKTPMEVLSVLRRTQVDAVVVDLTRTTWEQDRKLLVAALESDPAEWRLTDDLPASAEHTDHLVIYSATRRAQNVLDDAELTEAVKSALANVRMPR